MSNESAQQTDQQLLDTKYCSGCEDDFYNGKNPYGIKQCWMREGAVMERRLLIPVDMPPPYTSLKPAWRYTCYKAKRMVNIKPEALDSRGFWKS